MPYRLSALAERDLDEIWSYVAADASPATADRLIDAIIDRFELLAEQPRMSRLRPEFGPGVRSLAVENHVIYYRHDGDVCSPEFSTAAAIRQPRGLSDHDCDDRRIPLRGDGSR